MNSEDLITSKMRIEESIQYSGFVPIGKIPLLKNHNYYVIKIPLDGDAPKEYIKAYFYYKNCPKKNNPQKWDGFYAKFGGKSYPHESITEYGINKIGEVLNLKMNESFLAKVNTQIRFLSKDFIIPGKMKLIHGVEILHEYFEDKDFIDEINKDRKRRREFLTFDVIESAFKHVHPIQSENLLIELVKLIAYDAIVGNNDRHFYNWGVIGNIRNEDNRRVEFTPIYDTARALLWNTTEEKIKQLYFQVTHGSNQLNDFILKSKPRFSFEGNPGANHFELLEYLINYNPKYRQVIDKLVTLEMENAVHLKLKSTIYRYFSAERQFLISKVLDLRFNKIRGLFND